MGFGIARKRGRSDATLNGNVGFKKAKQASDAPSNDTQSQILQILNRLDAIKAWFLHVDANIKALDANIKALEQELYTLSVTPSNDTQSQILHHLDANIKAWNQHIDANIKALEQKLYTLSVTPSNDTQSQILHHLDANVKACFQHIDASIKALEQKLYTLSVKITAVKVLVARPQQSRRNYDTESSSVEDE